MTFMTMVADDADGWSADRDALTEAVRARWPEAETDTSEGGEVRGIIWRFETENGPGEAYLHAKGTCLYMDTGEEDAIRLAIAFRGLTPARLDLVFCDEGYSFDVRVPAGTTEHGLTALVDAAE
ncbi:hypothetical protein ACIQRS_20915 [Streptomyces termitum]|uniref:Uncharacterized protein n=1 Tax=Streptomyces termitum TaxID=67368 RepID=A0A918WAM5_9ACTN|nr:hypothetical protein [Streptomyces termitum]GHA86085.1 hypothetical protein GCM10010305_32430 [Streptomyces termitum]